MSDFRPRFEAFLGCLKSMIIGMSLTLYLRFSRGNCTVISCLIFVTIDNDYSIDLKLAVIRLQTFRKGAGL